MVFWSSTKINSSKAEQNSYSISFEANWKHAWTMVYFFARARPCSFRQCVTFHPNNLVHLHLCQQWQGAQVGSICRMQFRPNDMGVGRIFSKGGAKVVKFDFSHSKLRKQPFFAEIFKILGAKFPLASLPTPMPNNIVVLPDILRLF